MTGESARPAAPDGVVRAAVPQPANARWRQAGRALVTKAIAELSYEELFVPRADGPDREAGAAGEPGEGGTAGESRYRLELTGGVTYTFRARRGALDSWRVEAGSIARHAAGRTVPAEDPLLLLTDAREVLGLDGATAAEALRELTATWSADAALLARLPTAAELADLPYHELEGWQGGHPCMLLNKGRLGFTDTDVRRYAPEARAAFRLPWLAIHRDLASFHGVPGLAADRLLAEELSDDTRQGFARVLAGRTGSPGDYVWLPVHPFHLDAAVRPLFAPYLADGRIVELGEAPDRYRPLASVRTLCNLDHPNKRNVKLPLLLRNTLVWRGLPAGPTAAAPDVTAWLHRLRERDPYLTGAGRIDLLGEVASVAVRHPSFDQVADAPYRYHELLGAVWREPVTGYLAPGERARTLAALLQVGADGRALVAELVARSGHPAKAWLGALTRALLPGLLHALCVHGVAFCPHGENTVVVYDRDELPRRIMLKDFAEDVNLLPQELPSYRDLPPAARSVLLRWPARDLAHSILSAIVAGHLRHFAALVDEHLGVAEPEFWALVRAEVAGYRERRDDGFGLTEPSFARVCLNREQLTGGGFHDRAEKDESFDLTYGTVPNPLNENAFMTTIGPAA